MEASHPLGTSGMGEGGETPGKTLVQTCLPVAGLQDPQERAAAETASSSDAAAAGRTDAAESGVAAAAEGSRMTGSAEADVASASVGE